MGTSVRLRQRKKIVVSISTRSRLFLQLLPHVLEPLKYRQKLRMRLVIIFTGLKCEKYIIVGRGR
jgi:hypothetical protein